MADNKDKKGTFECWRCTKESTYTNADAEFEEPTTFIKYMTMDDLKNIRVACKKCGEINIVPRL